MSFARARRAVAVALLRFAVALACYSAGAIGYRHGLGWTGQPGIGEVVLTTAVVALVLWVVDEPLGRLADRLAFGAGASGQRVVRGLLHRMASTLPVDEVVPRLAEAAGRTVGGSRAEVRVMLADGQHWSQVWPPAAAPAGSSVTVDVRHGGDSVGEIEVDGSAGPTERRLLDELAAPAGLALSTVRLTVELRQRIAELDRLNAALRASRERMLTARQDEQRRLEREVDDHVMRHVDVVSRALAGSDGPLLSEAAAHCEQALDELRVIARGIFPPRLSDAGLIVSLEGWLERAKLHADLEAGSDLARLHGQADLEACLYFCAVTALDALALGGRTGLSVRVHESDTELVLRVAGHGDGRVNPDAVAAVRDRIEAFDGTLETLGNVIICRAPLSPPGSAS